MTHEAIRMQDREVEVKLMKEIESEKKLTLRKILHIFELNAMLSSN